METRSDHNHNQRANHPGVDRLPDDVIFTLADHGDHLPDAPEAQSNILLLDADHIDQPPHYPHPKGSGPVLIPTVNSHKSYTP